MNYSEMKNQPFVVIPVKELGGMLVMSRDVSQLTAVVAAISRRGLLVGKPRTYQTINQTQSSLFVRDGEGGVPPLQWRSIITRKNGRYSVPVRWKDVPGYTILAELLTPDEQKFLTFTLNQERFLQGDCTQYDGFASYSQSLIALLGGSI